MTCGCVPGILDLNRRSIENFQKGWLCDAIWNPIRGGFHNSKVFINDQLVG